MVAGLATGVWSGLDEIRALWACDTTFYPRMEAAQRQKLLADWDRAVERSRGWSR